MKQVMLVSHGTFASGLKNAIEMMTGPRADIISIGLKENMDIEMFRKIVQEQLRKFRSQDEILLFCDLLGGSPFTNSMELIKQEGFIEKSIIMTGMNMPVVLNTVLTKESHELDELRNEIKGMGLETVQVFEFPEESCDMDAEL